ncbi:MAG: SDR family NAD(P)-dependent oxidoreductase [Chloroflexi bacterium]|nr:SDR family NAD(P)-dependent oxidoreductase [Chloroflexota bacterium]
MAIQGMNVLVTGAGGFVGSHLVQELLARGAKVRAFLRYTSEGNIGMLRYLAEEERAALELHYGDLRDADAVLAAARGMSAIIHLGALIGIPYSFAHLREVLAVNVQGTLNVLQAARAHGSLRVIHASSSEVYGSAQTVPIGERHPLNAQSPYAASKTAADQLVGSFRAAFDLPTVILRPFNTYGPRQSTRAVIPAILTQALAGGPIRLGALHPTRDFTYVEDVVAGYCLALESDAALGRSLNLGTNREIRIAELARQILELVGRGDEIDSAILARDEARLRPGSSEVDRLRADAAAARAVLGWEAAVPLEEGLRRCIDWYREHGDSLTGKYRI